MGLMDTLHVAVEWRKRFKQSAHLTLVLNWGTRSTLKLITLMSICLWSRQNLFTMHSNKMVEQTPPSAQKRFQDQFPDVQFDWNEMLFALI